MGLKDRTKKTTHLARRRAMAMATATAQATAATTTATSRVHPGLQDKLANLALPLSPLVQINTGYVHPRFPQRLLNYWLLTDAELDDLAAFYHQSALCYLSRLYPCPVAHAWSPRLHTGEKRRLFGRFIGLRMREERRPPQQVVAGVVMNLNLSAGVQQTQTQAQREKVDQSSYPDAENIARWLWETTGLAEEEIEKRVRVAREAEDELRRKVGGC